MIQKFNSYIKETKINKDIKSRDEKILFIINNQSNIKDVEKNRFPFASEELDKMNDMELNMYYTELKNILNEQDIEPVNECKRETSDILRLNKYIDFDGVEGFIQKIDSNYVYIYDVNTSVKDEQIVKISIKEFIRKYNKENKK